MGNKNNFFRKLIGVTTCNIVGAVLVIYYYSLTLADSQIENIINNFPSEKWTVRPPSG